jgi:hypothetical protein
MASEPQRDSYPSNQALLRAELPFVSVKDGAQIDQRHRAIIRSQVMLDFYKKQLPQEANNELPMSESRSVSASTPRIYMNRFRVVTPDLRKRRMEASKRRMEGSKTRPIRPRLFLSASASRRRLDSATTEPEDLLSQHLVALIALPEGDPVRIRALTHHYCRISCTLVVYAC